MVGELSFTVSNVPHNTSGNLYMVFYGAESYASDIAIDETIQKYNNNTQAGEPLYALSSSNNTTWDSTNPNYNWTESGRHQHTVSSDDTDYNTNSLLDFEKSILKLVLVSR